MYHIITERDKTNPQESVRSQDYTLNDGKDKQSATDVHEIGLKPPSSCRGKSKQPQNLRNGVQDYDNHKEYQRTAERTGRV